MRKVFAYDHHDGFLTDMFLCDRILSDTERYCKICGKSDTLISEVLSIGHLQSILLEHGFEKDSDAYQQIMHDYQRYSGILPKEKILCLSDDITEA